MKKESFLWVLVPTVIAGGFLLHIATRPAPAKAPSVIETPTLSGSSYVEHAQYYDIAVNYASSTPLRGEAGTVADTVAVARMKAFVSDSIAQFRSDGDFSNISSTTAKEMGFGSGRKQTLNIRYLIASSPRTVSYIYTTFRDTFGAHPNTTFRTFTFDTHTGAELSLADLFLPDADYLAALSRISREKLPRILGTDVDATFVNNFIEPGTTPETKNFRNFFLDNHGLVILFDPYQVAPYAAGPQTLIIPLSELAHALKEAYR